MTRYPIKGILDAAGTPKPLVFIGSSRKDLRCFPSEVQDVVGRALLRVQLGSKPPKAKPLQGFGGAGVLEVVADFEGDTFRTVYTVRFPELVYVLHAFQKKATHGISTPKHEIDLIRARYKAAEEHYCEWSRGGADERAD